MKKKLELKKEVVARLDDDQMKQMMGGTDLGISCLGTCNTRTCVTNGICVNTDLGCEPEEVTLGKTCDCLIFVDDSNLAECWN